MHRTHHESFLARHGDTLAGLLVLGFCVAAYALMAVALSGAS